MNDHASLAGVSAAPTGAAAAHARDRRRRRRTALLAAPAAAWVLVAVVAPLVMVVWVSGWRTDGAQLVQAFDLDTWSNALSDATYRGLIWQTLKTSAIVLALVAAIGLAAGYFLARFVRSPRLQMVLLLLTVLPFWTSSVVRIITWQPLFGNSGVLNYLLTKAGIVSEPVSAFLYSQPATIFAMTSLYVVFVVGPVYWALSRIDVDVLAASRTLGASPWRTFWTVELPLARGGLVAGCFFAAIFLFGDYATERLIGGGTHPALSGTVSSVAGSGQWPIASVLAVWLLAIAFGALAALMKIHDLRREL